MKLNITDQYVKVLPNMHTSFFTHARFLYYVLKNFLLKTFIVSAVHF